MSAKLHICHIFEAIGPYSGIGKVAMSDVQIALDAGYRVTVIAKRLHESLRDRVNWVPLYVPPRLFYVQWMTARFFIKRALARAKRQFGPFDIIHAHQPQVADLADVFQCHFLTRVAYERRCLEERKDLRSRFVRLQQQGVLYAEDWCYRRWNPRTRLIFCSELLQREFHRLYGAPLRHQVLVNPCPAINIAQSSERRQAKQSILGEVPAKPVIGYIGGLHERKGYKRLIKAMKEDTALFLLMAGDSTLNLSIPEMAGRMKGVGLVKDTARFFAACDIVVVPSFFDPCPLVVFEAASRGCPVIVTDGVGNAQNVTENGCGALWNPDSPIGPVVARLLDRRNDMLLRSKSMAGDLSLEKYGESLRNVYEEVLSRFAEGLVHSPPLPGGDLESHAI